MRSLCLNLKLAILMTVALFAHLLPAQPSHPPMWQPRWNQPPPLEETPEAVVSAVPDTECLNCHASKQRLIDTAAPVVEAEGNPRALAEGAMWLRWSHGRKFWWMERRSWTTRHGHMTALTVTRACNRQKKMLRTRVWSPAQAMATRNSAANVTQNLDGTYPISLARYPGRLLDGAGHA